MRRFLSVARAWGAVAILSTMLGVTACDSKPEAAEATSTGEMPTELRAKKYSITDIKVSMQPGATGAQTEPGAKPAGQPGAQTKVKPGEPMDIAGLQLTVLSTGGILLKGSDRWGKALERTYESKAYLQNGLPVLERRLTKEQADGLRQIMASL